MAKDEAAGIWETEAAVRARTQSPRSCMLPPRALDGALGWEEESQKPLGEMTRKRQDLDFHEADGSQALQQRLQQHQAAPGDGAAGLASHIAETVDQAALQTKSVSFEASEDAEVDEDVAIQAFRKF
ncbi:uncharacterized protein LOC117074980 [Trachypithecus francoisi]|uniref:uncharacterized protein LOC117074980 n=1 Tax=Trachypithecus francoisi TaxID=54180 RepID=UPI00141AE2BC|nr:uncharacterized protein LOC117074980 [Trachypithecus francoisi]